MLGSEREGGRVAYLPGHQLESVLVEGLHLVEPGHDDLLQLLEAVRLERHPGQTLETVRKTSSGLGFFLCGPDNDLNPIIFFHRKQY